MDVVFNQTVISQTRDLRPKPVFGLVVGVPEPSVDMGMLIVSPPPPPQSLHPYHHKTVIILCKS